MWYDITVFFFFLFPSHFSFSQLDTFRYYFSKCGVSSNFGKFTCSFVSHDVSVNGCWSVELLVEFIVISLIWYRYSGELCVLRGIRVLMVKLYWIHMHCWAVWCVLHWYTHKQLCIFTGLDTSFLTFCYFPTSFMHMFCFFFFSYCVLMEDMLTSLNKKWLNVTFCHSTPVQFELSFI